MNYKSNFLRGVTMRFFGWLPDSLYLRLIYLFMMGKKLHLKNPQTLNEKIQWLKIHDNSPRHTKMVDKYAVKEIVEKIIDHSHIIPTLKVYESVNDINLSDLPDQFVLKTTHGGGSGGVVVCKDKKTFDLDAAKEKLSKSMKSKAGRYREWVYSEVPRKIIAEQYMEDENGELRDYKFFCMNGEPRFLFLASGRMEGHDKLTFDFLDLDYKQLPVKNGHPNSKNPPVKPQNFDEMIEIARKLSIGEPFVRVDLYNIRGKVYFGEFTFFHFSGLTPFEPEEWDKKFGDMITLPTQYDIAQSTGNP